MINPPFDYSSEIREETFFECKCEALQHFEKVVSSISIKDKICEMKISNSEFIYEFRSYPTESPYSYEKLQESLIIGNRYDFRISVYNNFGQKLNEHNLSLTLTNINLNSSNSYSILEFSK